MEKGDIINIYLNHKLQFNFEGAAKLIELKEVGHSFVINDEKLFTKLEDRAIGKNGAHLPLTSSQIENNKKYARMVMYFEGSPQRQFIHPEVKELKELLIDLAEDKTQESMNKMYSLLFQYRLKWKGEHTLKSYIFDHFTDDLIVRFIYQRYMKNWTHTIWREEKWLVEFLPEQYGLHNKMCLFSKPFRTYRKVRRLICICPNEDTQNCEMVFYTTNSKGVSGHDRKIARKEKKNEEEESDLFEEEIDEDLFLE
jgi:hypothetical protein